MLHMAAQPGRMSQVGGRGGGRRGPLTLFHSDVRALPSASEESGLHFRLTAVSSIRSRIRC